MEVARGSLCGTWSNLWILKASRVLLRENLPHSILQLTSFYLLCTNSLQTSNNPAEFKKDLRDVTGKKLRRQIMTLSFYQSDLALPTLVKYLLPPTSWQSMVWYTHRYVQSKLCVLVKPDRISDTSICFFFRHRCATMHVPPLRLPSFPRKVSASRPNHLSAISFLRSIFFQSFTYDQSICPQFHLFGSWKLFAE
jgi:hypothetical protein